MHGAGVRPATEAETASDQFPPLPLPPLPGDTEPSGNMPGLQMDAMQRLADRQASSGDAGNSKVEGFESSIHKIKEQVLPACSNASIPKPLRRSTRTSWPRNSARLSAKCSPS